MLLVKRISKRLKCINPRLKSVKRSRDADQYDNFEEHLVAELCVKQDFPACLWIQAKLLPSILYRVIQFLRAEQLLKAIATEMSFDYIGEGRIEKWKPLALDERSVPKPGEVCSPVKSKPVIINAVEEINADFLHTQMNEVPKFFNPLMNDIKDKLLEVEYPWKDSEEPLDIDRNLNLSLLDIHNYDAFIRKKVAATEVTLKNNIQSPVKLAITYNEADYVYTEIKLLKNKDSTHCPELVHMYRALTAKHCREIVHYERLETLGDSFLKFIATLYVFTKFSKFDEGKATSIKSKLISNCNLYYIALNKNIPGYLQFNEFEPESEWSPPGFGVPSIFTNFIRDNKFDRTSLYKFFVPTEEQISGALSQDTINSNLVMEMFENSGKDSGEMVHFYGMHYVPDKVIADVMEALLGAYIKTAGIPGIYLLHTMVVLDIIYL